MIRSRMLLGTALVGMSVIAPLPSDAEPIQIPVFTASVWPYPNWQSSPIVLKVNGPSLSFEGETARDAQSGQQLSPCYPRQCVAGGSVDFSGVTRTFGFDSYGDGELTIGGERFDVRSITGQFAVTSPVAAIPDVVNGLAEVTVPIRVTASLVAFLSGEGQTERFVDLLLVGSGTAHMNLLRPPPTPGGPPREGWLDDVTLDFASSGDPAPVPEPGTLLLLGTGAVVIGRRAWKCRIDPKCKSANSTE